MRFWPAGSASAAVLVGGAASASVSVSSSEWRYSTRLCVVLLIQRSIIVLLGLDLGFVGFFWSGPFYSFWAYGR